MHIDPVVHVHMYASPCDGLSTSLMQCYMVKSSRNPIYLLGKVRQSLLANFRSLGRECRLGLLHRSNRQAALHGWRQQLTVS